MYFGGERSIMEERESLVEFLGFIGSVLEAPEVVGVIAGALELVDVVAGFGM